MMNNIEKMEQDIMSDLLAGGVMTIFGIIISIIDCYLDIALPQSDNGLMFIAIISILCFAGYILFEALRKLEMYDEFLENESQE